MNTIKNKDDFRTQQALYLSLKAKQDSVGRATWTRSLIQMTRIGDALVHYAVTMFETGKADYKTARDAMPTDNLRDKLITALMHKGHSARDLLSTKVNATNH